VTLNSTQNGDSGREERHLANRWHEKQKHPTRKVSHLTMQTGAMLSCEFEDPIVTLKDVHLRIKRFLHVLWVIADRAAGRELTSDEIAAVRSAMDYIRVEGTRHTADEEQSLFPRLRSQTISGDSEELLALEDNRRRADPLHAMVEALYLAWISAGALRPESQLRLQSCAESLKRLWEQHVQLEEQIVFPRARHVLDGRAIAAIRHEFRVRRS